MKRLPNDLAYLAGFIDGEGCIGIHKIQRETGKAAQVLMLSITNTDKNILKWCCNILSIPKTLKTNNKGNNKHKRSYRLYYTCRQAESAIKIILPYLKLKRKQATLALQHRRLTKRNGWYTYKENQVRDNIIMKLHKLNQRGPK